MSGIRVKLRIGWYPDFLFLAYLEFATSILFKHYSTNATSDLLSITTSYSKNHLISTIYFVNLLIVTSNVFTIYFVNLLIVFSNVFIIGQN